MINTLVRSAHALMAVIRVASGALLVGSVAVNFANIIGRYFLSVSIPWAEEVMLFMMIACVFLNCGLVGWSGRQIRMDAFVALLPPKLRSIVELVGEIVLMATSLTETRPRAMRVTSSIGLAEAAVYEAVRLTIRERSCTMDVMEVPDTVPVLIGQLPLEHLDFVIDMRSHTLIGNPAHGGEHMYELY